MRVKKSRKTVFWCSNRAVTTGKRARQSALSPITSSKRACTSSKSPSRTAACPQRSTKSGITTSNRAITSSNCPITRPACPSRSPACPATSGKRARESSIYGNLLNSSLHLFLGINKHPIRYSGQSRIPVPVYIAQFNT